MKKILSLILVLTMVLALCACAGSGEEGGKSQEGLQVGFGRVNITPDYEVDLSGGAASRTSTGYQDYLYLTCVAIRENGETFIIGTMDFICAEDLFVDPAKAAMSEETGVPAENILLNATHTHASVAIRSDGSKNVEQYRRDFFEWSRQAAKAAVEDLSPAELWYGSVEATGMAWVRHYVMADGTFAGPNFGSFNSGIVSHTTEADVELQMIKFVRPAEDKKDVVLMNYPAHATLMQKSTSLSADFPGPTRDYIEANTDSLVAYFIAAAGDQVPNSRVATEVFSNDYQVYGAELGRIAVECMNNLTKQETTGIRHGERTFTAKYIKEGVDRLDDAKAVQGIWNVVGRGTTQGANAAKEYGFSSVYEVSAVLNRAAAPETNSMDIRVLAIGDVSFIFAPYEMFGSEGMYIKENSPYPMTFVITCAEGAEGYLPSLKGFEINAYEAQVTKFERGSAEKLADEFVAMLTEMKTAQ